MTQRKDQTEVAGPDPDGEADGELRSLFARTAVTGAALDAQALLAVAAVQRALEGRRSRRWAIGGVAAALLLAMGAGSGWWAGRQAARQASASMGPPVEVSREDLLRDMARLGESLRSTLEADRADEMKRVAVLLRDDYSSRLAEIGVQVAHLQILLDQLAVDDNGPIQRVTMRKE